VQKRGARSNKPTREINLSRETRAIGCGRLVEASLYVNTIVNIRNFVDQEFLGG
jgi:hypothetical protein